MKKTKFLAILLVALMVLSAMSLTAFADGNADGSVETKYGTIPAEYANAATYPFAMFADGEFITADKGWTYGTATNGDFINDGILNKLEKNDSIIAGKDVTILLRTNYTTGGSGKDDADYVNVLKRPLKSLTLDLGGNKLSAMATHLFYMEISGDGGGYPEKSISIINGTLSGHSSKQKQIFSVRTPSTGATFTNLDITLENVTVVGNHSYVLFVAANSNSTGNILNVDFTAKDCIFTPANATSSMGNSTNPGLFKIQNITSANKLSGSLTLDHCKITIPSDSYIWKDSGTNCLTTTPGTVAGLAGAEALVNATDACQTPAVNSFNYSTNNDGTHIKTRTCCSTQVDAEEACEWNSEHKCVNCNYQGQHVFDKQVLSSTYLKDAATCTTYAVYYKSCVCGGASTTETFTYEAGGYSHTFDANVAEAQYLINEANCEKKATYAVSCSVCGAASPTATFEVGDLNPDVHNFQDGEWVSEGGYHWQKCHLHTEVTNEANKEAHDTAPAVLPNCTQDTLCRCGEVIVTAIAAHDFENGPFVPLSTNPNEEHCHRCANCEVVDTSSSERHTAYDHDNNCATAPECECGAVIGDAAAHDFDNGTWVSLDNTHHAKKCANCSAKDEANKAAHDAAADTDHDCSTATKCQACNKVVLAAAEHTYVDGACTKCEVKASTYTFITKVKAIASATDSTKFTAISDAIKEYKKLSAADKTSAATRVNELKAAIASYNEAADTANAAQSASGTLAAKAIKSTVAYADVLAGAVLTLGKED